jgi:hypothetical protein
VYVHNLPRAVTKEKFDRVQQILGRNRTGKKNHNRSHKTTLQPFPYSGLLHCATCGYKVTAEVSKGHTYYHCSNRLGICTKKGIREEELERQISWVLESITMDPQFETLALEILDDLRRDELGIQEDFFESRQKAVADLKRQKDALLGLYLQGHLEEAEYAEKKKELSMCEVELKLEEQGAEQRLDSSYETMENMAHFVVHAKSLFQREEAPMKRMIATHLASEYRLNNGELQIELHPMFAEVRTLFKSHEAELKRFEPSKTGSGSLKSEGFVPINSIWQSHLSLYRGLVRERNWTLPTIGIAI